MSYPNQSLPTGMVRETTAMRLIDTMIATTRVFDREFPDQWTYDVDWNDGSLTVSVIMPLWSLLPDQSVSIERPPAAKFRAQSLKTMLAAARKEWSARMAACRARAREGRLSAS